MVSRLPNLLSVVCCASPSMFSAKACVCSYVVGINSLFVTKVYSTPVAGITASVGVGTETGAGFGILQAASNNKIMTALAAANTFFIFMVDILLVRSWFGRDIDSLLPDKRKETISRRVRACLFIINNTLPSRIHQLGSVLLRHLGELFYSPVIWDMSLCGLLRPEVPIPTSMSQPKQMVWCYPRLQC